MNYIGGHILEILDKVEREPGIDTYRLCVKPDNKKQIDYRKRETARQLAEDGFILSIPAGMTERHTLTDKGRELLEHILAIKVLVMMGGGE